MSRSFDGTNDALSYSGAVVDATNVDTTPKSFACWIKRGRATTGSDEFLMCAGTTAAPTSHYLALSISGTDTIQARARTTSNANATSSATITDTTNWHLVVAVFTSITSRTVYVDGNAGVTDTTSKDPVTATDLFRIGATPEAAFGSEYQGLIAYPTVWNNLALTSGNVSSLWNGGAGVDPLTIQNASIVAHWRLTGNVSPEPSSVGSFDLTLSGTTFSSDNPFSISGGGSGVVPQFMNVYGRRRRRS